MFGYGSPGTKSTPTLCRLSGITAHCRPDGSLQHDLFGGTITPAISSIGNRVDLQLGPLPSTGSGRPTARTAQNPFLFSSVNQRHEARSVTVRAETNQISSKAFRALDAMAYTTEHEKLVTMNISMPIVRHQCFVYHQIMNVEPFADAAVSRIAAAIGEPARAHMLYCLVDGRARTSTKLAAVANVTASTASIHLQRLKTERLVKVIAQGKHRYYSLEGTMWLELSKL